ncbi:MAG: hypothetical protein ACI4CS_01195 [Candidatus Weimeria sp.]
MDRRENPTPEQLRLYRRRKRMLQKRRRQRQRLLLVLAAIAVVAVVIIVAVALGAFEKRSDVNLLTIKADGTVVYEENQELKDSSGLKKFVKSEIRSYNDENGSDDVVLERFAKDGNHCYLRTRYKNLTVYSDFTGYEAYNGKLSDAKAAGYDTSGVSFRELSGSASGDSLASADAFADQKVLVIKEWGIDVKVPGTVTAVSDASYIKKTDDSDRVTISKESDSAAAPLTYIIYK